MEKSIVDVFYTAAEDVLPRQRLVARRPWVSNRSLELIDARNACRNSGKMVEEVELRKEIQNRRSMVGIVISVPLLVLGNGIR